MPTGFVEQDEFFAWWAMGLSISGLQASKAAQRLAACRASQSDDDAEPVQGVEGASERHERLVHSHARALQTAREQRATPRGIAHKPPLACEDASKPGHDNKADREARPEVVAAGGRLGAFCAAVGGELHRSGEDATPTGPCCANPLDC